MAKSNLHNSRASFELNGKEYNYYRLAALEEAGIANVSRLPYSIKVLLRIRLTSTRWLCNQRRSRRKSSKMG